MGLPIGEKAYYVQMQMHYENLDLDSGMVDNSGMRTFITPNLREFDAGFFTVGLLPNFFSMVPPGQEDFKVTSKCFSNCTGPVRQTVFLNSFTIDFSILYVGNSNTRRGHKSCWRLFSFAFAWHKDEIKTLPGWQRAPCCV